MRILMAHKKKIISLILFSIVAIICLISYISFPKNNNVYAVEENCLDEKENISLPSEFYVDIKGAVKNPGVYLVNENNIIKDIIDMAGGLSKNATTSNINLSQKVTSEMVITVNTKSEVTTSTTKVPVVNSNEVCTTKVISNCETSSEKKLVNINTATKEELMGIPNIGASKADAIIIYRTENRFTKIEDIINVSGIGETLFVKIKDHITI